MRFLLAAASQIPPGAPAGRHWLERLHWIVPGSDVTRWLLLADLLILALMVSRSRRPVAAAVVALGFAFLVINVAGLLFTDFFLGLAAFHVLTAAVALSAAGLVRWSGAALLALAMALGVLT
jgi:hypothetical protein